MFSDISTPKQKRIALSLLNQARKHIKSRHRTAVCSAVSCASSFPDGEFMNHKCTDRERGDVADDITGEIEYRLGYSNLYVTDWLINNAGVDFEKVTDARERQYRVRWIASMMKEIRELKV